MNIWRDNTIYARGDKEKIPSTWHLRVGWFTICVHRHIYYPKDVWLLTAEPFFKTVQLKEKNIEEAQAEAEQMVYEELLKAIRELEGKR